MLFLVDITVLKTIISVRIAYHKREQQNNIKKMKRNLPLESGAAK